MSDNFYKTALDRAESMIRDLQEEREKHLRAIKLFLDLDPFFTRPSLQFVKELAEESDCKKNKLARVVLAARLALGEDRLNNPVHSTRPEQRSRQDEDPGGWTIIQ